MAKSKRVEKETRKLIEAVSDLVKKKGDRYKFKSKNKKVIKQVKRTCPHWIYRKGKEVPCLTTCPDREGYWKCKICGAEFPIKPLEYVDGVSGYEAETKRMLELVNQIQFWATKLGGDAEDTKMFLRLRENLPRFEKVAKQVVKRVNKREQMSRDQQKRNAMSQFSDYSSFQYR